MQLVSHSVGWSKLELSRVSEFAAACFHDYLAAAKEWA
jgi:hypothetical protein